MQPTLSTKALLLKALYKEALRKQEPRAVTQQAEARRARLLLHSGYQPSRAFGRLRDLLLELDVRSAWHFGKANAKQQLRDAYAAVEQRYAARAARRSPSSTSTAAAATPEELAPLYGKDGLLRASLLYVLAHASRGLMHTLNSTHVEGGHHLAAALQRPAGTALITVSNHVASMDDPLVVSAIVPPKHFADASKLRWTLCATDRCFHKAALVPFFRTAKVLPVQRGAGMAQPGLQAAEARLAAGEWVHIFPEGTRSKDGKAMGPVRNGVGRLVAACEAAPVVIPFVHSGMEQVMPRGAVLPRVGQEVRVLVGEPVEVSDLLSVARAHEWDEDELYVRLAGRIGGAIQRLKAQLDGVPMDDASAAAAEACVSGLDLYDDVDARIGSSSWSSSRGRELWESMKERAVRSIMMAGDASSLVSADGAIGSGQHAAGSADGDTARELGEASAWGGGYSSTGSRLKGVGGLWAHPVGLWSYARHRSAAMVQLLQGAT